MLINNGYAPEWVMLEKEIRQDRTRIREALLRDRRRIGQLPLSAEDEVSLVKMIYLYVNKLVRCGKVPNSDSFLRSVTAYCKYVIGIHCILIPSLPCTPFQEKWKSALNRQAESISELNKKINKYNLLVPILSKQTVHFPLARESEKVLKEGLSKDQIPAQEEEATERSGSISGKPSGIRKLFDLLTVLRNP